MTGSLQISKNYYYVVAWVPDESGELKQRWKSTGFTVKGNNKRKAEQKMKEILSEWEKERGLFSSDVSLLKWIEMWLATKETDIRGNTYESYVGYYNKHIKSYFACLNLKVKDVMPMHIKQFYNHLLKQNLSGDSVRKIATVIRQPLDDAVANMLIVNNPARSVKTPPKKKYISKRYTVEQANKLLSVLDNEPLKPAVILGLIYGLSRSEALGLRWKDISIENGTLLVENTVVRQKTKREEETTKTNARNTTMFIRDMTKTYFMELREERVRTMELCGLEFSDDVHVLSWDDGSTFEPSYISRNFKKLLVKNGLEVIRFHELRHTAGSLLLDEGYSIKHIQEFLRHERIETTLAHYLPDDDKRKREASEAMENILQM